MQVKSKKIEMSFDEQYSLRNDKLSVKLRESQMSASTIGKIFNVFPQSIVLISDDGSVATPDASGVFMSGFEL